MTTSNHDTATNPQHPVGATKTRLESPNGIDPEEVDLDELIAHANRILARLDDNPPPITIDDWGSDAPYWHACCRLCGSVSNHEQLADATAWGNRHMAERHPNHTWEDDEWGRK